MSIKYTREGFRNRSIGSQNRYEARSRFAIRDPRKRLLIIYLGLGFMSIVLVVYHFASQRVAFGWLEERAGTGIILEKRIEAQGDSDPRYILVVEVLVPPADEVDAAQYPEGLPDRAEALGLHEFVDTVRVPESHWRAVESGASIRVDYSINVMRDRVRIQGLALSDAELVPVSGAANP